MVNFKSNLQTFNGVSILDFTFVEVGVAASLIYDTRDNTLMPASGYVFDHPWSATIRLSVVILTIRAHV